jgi:hypothetical protein
MESQPSRTKAPPWANRIADGADAAQIAESLAATWEEIAAALAPVIGKRGVAALYWRCRYLAGSTHPWLAATPEDVPMTMDIQALKSVVANRSRADAVAGGSALLQAFHELLSSLIGPALTERMLRSIWTDSSTAPAAQDITP